jgi:hypothetical protein
MKLDITFLFVILVLITGAFVIGATQDEVAPPITFDVMFDAVYKQSATEAEMIEMAEALGIENTFIYDADMTRSLAAYDVDTRIIFGAQHIITELVTAKTKIGSSYMRRPGEDSRWQTLYVEPLHEDGVHKNKYFAE